MSNLHHTSLHSHPVCCSIDGSVAIQSTRHTVNLSPANLGGVVMKMDVLHAAS